MRHILLIILALAASLCSCNHDKTESKADAVDSVNLVMRISQVSKLYTAEYQIHKIVTHDDILKMKGNILGIKYDKSFHLGERKIAIPIDVTMMAYIDFSSFGERNVEKIGQFIHIILPDPKVLVTASRVDYENMKEFTSIIRTSYSDEERSEISRKGVESIIKQVPEIGIIETARECAAKALIPMLVQMGYKEDHIVITFRDDLDTTKLNEIYDNEHSIYKIQKP